MIKAPVPVRAGDGLDPPYSLVADPADGADGVVGSVLAHGRYPDRPRSQPPLAAEDDLNPECAEEGRLNRSAPRRKRKRLHAGAAAKPDGRVLGDPPSIGADFDATPELIGQIEVD